MRAFQADKVPRPRQAPSLPIDWLNSPTPLDLEIGCGVGWHPISYARTNTDRNLIAIEQTEMRFEAFQRRLISHGPNPNLLAVHANAISWVTYELPPDSISRLFLLYPNPSPKNPALRWFRMPFFSTLLEKMKTEGLITLATNEAVYAKEVLDYGKRVWGLQLKEHKTWNRKTDPRAISQTHFERKYFERGDTLHRIEFLVLKKDPNSNQDKQTS